MVSESLSFAAQNCRMLKLISSMATRQLLAESAALWQNKSGIEVVVESVGGVDVVKRVQAGEVFDGAVLAAEAIDKLISGGHLLAGSRVDLVRSNVAFAVKQGATAPDMSSEAALRQAIEAAQSIGYSTGPSGIALIKLFEHWGIYGNLASRLVQAPPGVPVATLVASGEVVLGFQQLSELMHHDGITVVGVLPESVAITTVFSAGTCAACEQADKLRQFLAWMAAPHALAIKQRHGMY